MLYDGIVIGTWHISCDALFILMCSEKEECNRRWYAPFSVFSVLAWTAWCVLAGTKERPALHASILLSDGDIREALEGRVNSRNGAEKVCVFVCVCVFCVCVCLCKWLIKLPKSFT